MNKNLASMRRDCEEVNFQPLPFINDCFSKPIAFQHDLYLTSEITGADDYSQWFQIINGASPNDTIIIHINCMGGVLDTAIQLYSALNNSEANINISVEGACCSGATMVLMAAHQLYIDNNAYFLFHGYSGGDIGKYSDLQENAKFQSKWFPQVTKEIYKDFLSEDEINQLLDDGKQIWMSSTEVTERFHKMILKRQVEAYHENPLAFQKLIQAGVIDPELMTEITNAESAISKTTKKSTTKKTVKKTTDKKDSKKETKESDKKEDSTKKDPEKKSTPKKIKPKTDDK